MSFIQAFISGASWFDWLLFSGVFFSMVLGLWRGFVRESLAIVAWVLGVMLVLNYVDDVSSLLASWIHVASIRLIISGLLLLIMMFVCVQLVKKMMLWIVEKAGIKSLDRVLGGGFGVARGVMIGLLVTVLTARVGFADEAWWSKSVVVPMMVKLNDKIVDYLPSHLVDTWKSYIQFNDKDPEGDQNVADVDEVLLANGEEVISEV
ncbi:MAG: CvpA family protein [Candidatus Comchoanobacterales bacterium]